MYYFYFLIGISNYIYNDNNNLRKLFSSDCIKNALVCYIRTL